ncbi:amino acid/polyamine/organocation transporter (APC superfamily) [Laceyella sediminis]|uniref:Amino acid/polyamine/organocation transporter (APC superfamily) n=1 Tax=Laceyella sediminis TaxID=573074 RepID=A0ABX5EQ25_9BACL|nr:amino acid permease [Laceyella sediminis]PRZ15371.1 amino acid/polyamine/organocation transporter (APC superfamily) [Laceyella sediminis]
MDLFRKKSISAMMQQAQTGTALKRTLGTWDLTLLGLGAIIGTGIFVLTGTGAVTAGPGIMISFLISGLACALTALCYAEFATLVPVSGSVYTFAYATLGELIAWIIGWDLILEYLLAVSLVSAGWSGYLQSLLQGLGISLPTALTAAHGAVPGVETWFNLPAFVVVIVITFFVARGVKESARVNNIMVLIKTAVVILFVIVGIGYVKPDNWHNFMPFGLEGVFSAAAITFTAFLGFDAVVAAAEETKNPAKDLPRGIMYSLFICILLYIVVSAIMTGIVPFAEFEGVAHPVSLALQYAGQDWVAGFIDLGAIVGMLTVMLVMLFGQTRIAFAMSRDGLLPSVFSKVHPKFQTPYRATWIIGSVAALLGGIVPLDRLAEMINIGTLTAFVLISLGVIVLRKTQPELPRKFRTPAVPFVPLLSMAVCIFLMTNLSASTWYAFLIWLTIGLSIYFLYSRKRSHLNG